MSLEAELKRISRAINRAGGRHDLPDAAVCVEAANALAASEKVREAAIEAEAMLEILYPANAQFGDPGYPLVETSIRLQKCRAQLRDALNPKGSTDE